MRHLPAMLLILILLVPAIPAATILQRNFSEPRGTGYLFTPDPAPVLQSKAPDYSTAPVKTVNLLVLLVDFPDQKHNVTTASLTDQVFGLNDSLGSYYSRASYGQFNLRGTVEGWFTAPHSLAYYGRDGPASVDDSNSTGSDTSYYLIAQIFQQEQASLGIIDDHPNILLIHAGPGQETAQKGGGTTDLVWSCTYTVTDPDTGTVVSEASIVPESELAGAVPFGVWTHELGHQLGLADLYGYEDSPRKWDLMSSGNWLGTPPGSTPAGPSPLELMILGWLPQENILQLSWNSSQYVMLDPLEQTIPSGTLAVVLNYRDGSYYVVGNRQRVGLDAGLPDSGIVIYHITTTPTLTTPSGGPDRAWQPGQDVDEGKGRVSVLATFTNQTTLVGTGDCDTVPTFNVQLMAAPGIPYVVLDGYHVILDPTGLSPTFLLPIGEHSVLFPTIESSGDQTRERLIDATLYAIMTNGFVPLTKFTPGTFAFDLEQSTLISAEYSHEVKITAQTEYGEAEGTGWYGTGTQVTLTVTPGLVPVSNGTRARFLQWIPMTNPDYNYSYRFQRPDKTALTFTAGSAPATIKAEWALEYETTIQPLDTNNQPYKEPYIIQLYRTGGGAYTITNSTAWLREGTYHVTEATTDQCHVAANQTEQVPLGVTAPHTVLPIILQASTLTITIRSTLGLPATTDLKILGCTTKTIPDAKGTIVTKQFPEGDYTAEWNTPYSLTGQEQFTVKGATTIVVQVLTWYDLLIVIIAVLIIGLGIRTLTKKPQKRERIK